MAAQPEMGTDAASDLAARMRAAFKNIEYFMVVGIGDGVPSYGSSGARSQIVLGGVVVSSPKGSYGGVIQYDYGAWMEEGRHEFFRHSNGPPATVLTAVNGLRAKHPLTPGMKIPCSLEEIRLKIREDERTYFKGQGANQDRLFQYNYPHPEASGNKNCKNCCNLKRSQLRESRGPQAIRQVDTPKIHYGNIGSSNQLQMSATKRNQLHKKLEVICFEMEGAGVIQRNPFLVIREICDYSDSHKNKKWQPYAAATAAAYAKELLEILPTSNTAKQTLTKMTEEDKTCIQHLRLTVPSDDKKRIENTKGDLLVDSCCWIFDNAEFRQWRDDEQSRLLWIKGDPGKGKTMLLCGIVNDLQKSKTDMNLLAYFFCQATDWRVNSAVAVLRGLMYLLVTWQPSLVSYIRKKYDLAGKALFEDTNSWIALTEIFTDILQGRNLKSTYLVIDALDECVTDLPQLLKLIAKQSSIRSCVKWIVSSRNRPGIEKTLEQVGYKVRLCLELNAESVSAAVSIFIEKKVSQLAQENRYDRQIQDTVKEHRMRTICSFG